MKVYADIQQISEGSLYFNVCSSYQTLEAWTDVGINPVYLYRNKNTVFFVTFESDDARRVFEDEHSDVKLVLKIEKEIQ